MMSIYTTQRPVQGNSICCYGINKYMVDENISDLQVYHKIAVRNDKFSVAVSQELTKMLTN